MGTGKSILGLFILTATELLGMGLYFLSVVEGAGPYPGILRMLPSLPVVQSFRECLAGSEER